MWRRKRSIPARQVSTPPPQVDEAETNRLRTTGLYSFEPLKLTGDLGDVIDRAIAAKRVHRPG